MNAGGAVRGLASPDVDIECDREYERRWWRAQRICWVVLDVVLILALLGLLGRGPLSKAYTDAAAPVMVGYERVARVRAPAMLEIELRRDAMQPQRSFVQLNDQLVETMSVQRIWPQPVAAQPVKGGMRLAFPTDPASAPGKIVITMMPGKPGRVAGRVEVEGQKPVTFTQWVLP